MKGTKDRIKGIRLALRLTQAAFGERIKASQNTIAGYESGRRSPSPSMVRTICREFGVREDWLLNGAGPMWADAPSNTLQALAAERNLTHGDVVFVERFLDMKPEARRAVIDFMLEFARAIVGGDIPAGAPEFPDGPPAAAQPGPAREGPAASGAERLEGLKKELERQVLLEEETAGAVRSIFVLRLERGRPVWNGPFPG